MAVVTFSSAPGGGGSSSSRWHRVVPFFRVASSSEVPDLRAFILRNFRIYGYAFEKSSNFKYAFEKLSDCLLNIP